MSAIALLDLAASPFRKKPVAATTSTSSDAETMLG